MGWPIGELASRCSLELVGFRLWSLYAHVNFKSATVSGFAYHLIVSAPNPNGVVISVSSRDDIEGSGASQSLSERTTFRLPAANGLLRSLASHLLCRR